MLEEEPSGGIAGVTMSSSIFSSQADDLMFCRQQEGRDGRCSKENGHIHIFYEARI